MKLDAVCFTWFQTHHPLFLMPVMKDISKLTTSRACCLWAGLVAVAFLFRHRFIRAWILFFGTVLAAILVELLKLVMARNRPPFSGIYDSYSFPSGHALTSAVFFGLLAWTLGQAYPRWQKLFYTVAIILPLFVGISRLYLGVHWATDVLGGFVIGFIFLRSWLWINKAVLIPQATSCRR